MTRLISTHLISFVAILLLGLAPTMFPSSSSLKPAEFFFGVQDEDEEQDKDDKDEDKDADKDKDKDDEDKDEEAKIETVTIEKQPLQLYHNVEGVFESTETSEIKTDFDSWTDLEIKSFVEQGTKVKKGDTLVEFEVEDIDKALVEAEFELKSAQLDWEDAELTKQQLDETYKMDKTAAEREWKQAQEDNTYYWEVEVPQRDKDLEFDLETAGFSLEYNKDELDQLEKMYTEDELTEESEEIVLKRARRGVKSSEWFLEMTNERLRRRKEVSHPREDQEHKDSYRKAELQHDRKMIELDATKQRSEIAHKRAKIALEDAEKKLRELQDDRKKMTIKSPAAGILFYGECERGTWSGNEDLEVGGSMSADAVVLTVVKDEVMIRASIKEENISLIKGKMKGKALIPALGRKTIDVAVKSVASIPLSEGGYDCKMLISGNAPEGILPGMTCKTAFLAYENKDALVAPEASVFSDDDGITHFVFVVTDGKAERKAVKIGHTASEKVEIVDGLSEGDEIAKDKQ